MFSKKEKMLKFYCTKCNFTELRPNLPYGRVPNRLEQWGRDVYDLGNQASLFTGAHKKGGASMNAAVGRDARLAAEMRKVCPECGSRKTLTAIVKV